MSVLCRTFGHDPARKGRRLDPFTFAEQAYCKRCGVALEHDAKGGWRQTVEAA